MRFPSPNDARVALAAVLGAYAASGGLDDLQTNVLDSFGAGLFGLDLHAEPITPLSAAEFRKVSTEELRHQAVAVMAVLEMVATPISKQAADDVATYAHHVGVQYAALHAARERARGHLRLMHADFQRSNWYGRKTYEGMMHGRFFELIESKVAYRDVAPSKKIAERWLALRHCPPGSWGRGVADFYVRNQFPFPGERKGIYELGARHDFVHVLTSYGADPEGELDVFAFIAAAMPGDHGITLLAVTCGLFQNGTITKASGKRIPIARTDTLRDPGALDGFTDALHRGSVCAVDVMAIDHFELAALPLDEVRDRLNVVPPRAAPPTA